MTRQASGRHTPKKLAHPTTPTNSNLPRKCSWSKLRGPDLSSPISFGRSSPKIKTKHVASYDGLRPTPLSKVNSTNAAYPAYYNGASHPKMDEVSLRKYTKARVSTTQAAERLWIKPFVPDS